MWSPNIRSVMFLFHFYFPDFPMTSLGYIVTIVVWPCQTEVAMREHTHEMFRPKCRMGFECSRWSPEAFFTSDDVIKWKLFSALLGIFAGNSPVPDEFPAQRPVARSFDVFFDRRLNKRMSKQWRGWWYETPSSPLWRHCNVAWWARPTLRLLHG